MILVGSSLDHIQNVAKRSMEAPSHNEIAANVDAECAKIKITFKFFSNPLGREFISWHDISSTAVYLKRISQKALNCKHELRDRKK